MKATFQTHVGWTREVNEDYGLISKLDAETLLIVIADGMGGHKAGDVASRIAVEVIETEIKANWQQKQWGELLKNAIQHANQHIYTEAQQNSDLSGMGTTIEVGLISKEKGLIAHVGDSRVYLIQHQSPKQLTDDHSLAYALYKSGQITLDEANNHPQKNVVLQALGTETEIDIDLIPFRWEEGDYVIFCTDGFSNHVKPEFLIEHLQKDVDLEQLSEELLQHALNIGGDDNISFILVENRLSHVEEGRE